MKLFNGEVSFRTVLIAQSAQEAEGAAETIIKTEDDSATHVLATEVKNLADLPEGWNAQCRPWGERDPMDRTIGQMLGGAPADARHATDRTGLPASPLAEEEGNADRLLLAHAAEIIEEDAQALFDSNSIGGKWAVCASNSADVAAWRLHRDMVQTAERLRAHSARFNQGALPASAHPSDVARN